MFQPYSKYLTTMTPDTIVHSALWEQLKMFLGLCFYFFIIGDGISSIARSTLTYDTNGDQANMYKMGRACVTYRTKDKYVLDFSENTSKEKRHLRSPRYC